jgi:tryptophan synthase alpha chain
VSGHLTAVLTATRDSGRKVLMPFVTGGITAEWSETLIAYQDAGADAIEVGLPFSDPMLDGATIQRASDRALARGDATAEAILATLAAVRERTRVPLVVSTYANLVFRPGPEVFVRRLADTGVAGLIVPDLPLDEAAAVETAAAAAGIDLVLLAAPSTPPDRLAQIGARSRGFVYAVSVMGTTGERDSLAGTASALAARIKAVTTMPVLIGFGVSGPAQAIEAGRAGDGVVVGAALMRRVLDGATPGDLGRDVAALRHALDTAAREVPTGTAYAEIPGHRR